MGHLIKNSKEHTSLFIPVYCVRKIEDQDSSSGIAGQSHKYDTRFPHENRSYNPQDSMSATIADEAKKRGMSPSMLKEKQKEALKMVEHKKEEAWREQEKVESKERRFKMQQIKNELQIGEIEGFDYTMLDLKRQAKIMEDLERQKKGNKQGQIDKVDLTYPESQHSVSESQSRVSSYEYHQDPRSLRGITQQGTGQQSRDQQRINQQCISQQGMSQQGMDQQSVGQQGIGRQGICQQGMNQQGMGQQDISQQVMGQQAMDQQSMGQQSMGRQGICQQGIGQQGIGQQGISQRGMGQQGMDQQGMGQQGMGQQGICQRQMSQQEMIQQVMGQQGISQQGMFQQETSKQGIGQGMGHQDMGQQSQQGMGQQGMGQQGIYLQGSSQQNTYPPPQDIHSQDMFQQGVHLPQQDIHSRGAYQQGWPHQGAYLQQMPHSQEMFQQLQLQQGIHSQGLQPQGMNNCNMPQLDPYQRSTSQNYQFQQCNLSPNNSNWQGENPSYPVERQHSTEFHQILRAETNESEPYRQMPQLEIGSAIQIGSNPIYGTIKWIGELSGSRGLIAGVEMVRKLCTIYIFTFELIF